MPDHARFLQLYLKAQPQLWSYLMALLRSTQDADDVCQQVSLILWERFGDYDARLPFLPWALGVARNHAARWRRDRRRDAWIPTEVEEKLAQASAELEDELAGRRAALRTCIERLGARARDMLALRYSSGLPLDRIARRMGMSLNAVNKALGKIRRFLSDCTGAARREGAGA